MTTITINKGEGILLELEWTNDDGTPIDLTGRTLGIEDAYPKALLAGTVSILDPLLGTGSLDVPPEIAAVMRAGRSSWVRLYMDLAGESRDTSSKIWIDVE